jgi:hypothetical protein
MNTYYDAQKSDLTLKLEKAITHVRKTVVIRKKVKAYKGFVIALVPNEYMPDSTEFAVYTKDEWSYGPGFGTAEMNGFSTLEQCEDFIDCY